MGRKKEYLFILNVTVSSATLPVRSTMNTTCHLNIGNFALLALLVFSFNCVYLDPAQSKCNKKVDLKLA